MDELISKRAAIDALWKALYEYEDKTEKQFQESEELDVADWFQHRIFVQNISDIDRQTILNLPPAHTERRKGKWIKGMNGHYKCSCCGLETMILDDKSTFIDQFCRWCGADMREESKNG